ncbi:MAG: multiheme c-type cytochrome [Pirellulales bacterium]|jgi:tetratricopeptide (TPR) repeat protein|nr:multiheme c-type cytochrome [Pirellulales bacterium]
MLAYLVVAECDAFSQTADEKDQTIRTLQQEINTLTKKNEDPSAMYVGRAVCAECHERETRLWQGSHHDLAMQEVSEMTMLGDFNDVTFEHFGVSSHFYRRGDDYCVETEGPNGDRVQYPIAYLFGFFPLQQYLVEFPGGRYQTLPLCWDARSSEEGGQRWFHIYDDERIAPDDELYWTSPLQNWNLQCAECHSTNLIKNYDRGTQIYDTTFNEIDVSCEACHGPGANHVAWAVTEPKGMEYERGSDFKLSVRLKEPQPAGWIYDPAIQQPKRTTPLQSHVQFEICARCHSRRGGFNMEYEHGASLLQTHQPALLEPPMYHADGQIEGEVYVWGSFMQSKMFAKDVRCVDCHEPHSLKLVRPIQQLCTSCHLSDKYSGPDHHHHEMQTLGAQCIDCHMPQRTYMVVDQRRDHSFRVPRPDLSVALGTPNACTDCHDDRSAQWAADMCLKWYGSPTDKPTSAAPAIHAATFNRAGADAMLINVVQDEAQSVIMRATAMVMLRDQPSEESLAVIRQQVQVNDPLLRMAALRAIALYPPDLRWQIGSASLDDDVRAVRIEAARVLAAESGRLAQGNRIPAFDDAMKELRVSIELNSDRPATIVSLGNLERDLGKVEVARHAYLEALRLQPNHVPASVNLADLHRDLGNEDEVMRVLKEALLLSPNEAALHHSLGLAKVRSGEVDAAVESLCRASELEPTVGGYVYIYAIALNSTGRGKQAIRVLEQATQDHPAHRDILYALATMGYDQGQIDLARAAAQQLVQLAPHVQQYQSLLNSLTSFHP